MHATGVAVPMALALFTLTAAFGCVHCTCSSDQTKTMLNLPQGSPNELTQITLFLEFPCVANLSSIPVFAVR